MEVYTPILMGIIGIIYLAVIIGFIVAIVVAVRALLRMADAQEETTRALHQILRRMDERESSASI